MTELQPAAVAALRFGQIAHRRERHRGRLPPLQEVQQGRDGGGPQRQERQRLQKSHGQPSRARRCAARRSTCPNGVSVVTWW
jgi:hypothetical protein